jgi:hypothetical protein
MNLTDLMPSDSVLRALSTATGGFLAGAALTMLVLAIPIAVSLVASYRLNWQQSVSSQSARFDLSLVALPVLALGLWAWSLVSIDTRHIPDIGLIASLPLLFFAALMVLAISFGFLLLINPNKTWLWLLHVGVLILILHGTLPILYEVPRFPWTYKHIGVTSYIQLHHGNNPGLDAYHNWPGFFALAALWTEALGLKSSLEFAKWAQLVFNLLYLGPLLMIYNTMARSRQAVWVAAWLFFMTTWVSQDYFAPQAFNFFLFLVVVAVVLTWLSSNPQIRVPKIQALSTETENSSNDLVLETSNDLTLKASTEDASSSSPATPISSAESGSSMEPGSTEPGSSTTPEASSDSTVSSIETGSSSDVNNETISDSSSQNTPIEPSRPNWYFRLMHQAVHSDQAGLETSPAQRYGLLGLIVLAFAVIVSSHQLTPFMMIAGLTALTFWRRTRYPWLPVVMLIMVVVWGLTFAKNYTSGQSQWYSTLGQFFQNLQENTSDSLEESQGRVTASLLIKVFVLCIWALAGLGAVQQMRRGIVPLRAMLLAVAPFPIILLNSYGGEMLLRIYFFSLPFMTILITGALPLREDTISAAAIEFEPIGLGPVPDLLGLDLLESNVQPAPVILRARNPWRVVPITAGLSLALAIGFICAYTAKEKFYRVNPEEVRVLAEFYATAPAESLVFLLNDQYLPIRLTGNYDQFIHNPWVDVTLDRNHELNQADDLEGIEYELEKSDRPMAFLIFSASQRDFFAENNILKSGSYERFRRLVSRSKTWKLAWKENEIEIYGFRNPKLPLPEPQNPPAHIPAKPLEPSPSGPAPLEPNRPERSLVGLK